MYLKSSSDRLSRLGIVTIFPSLFSIVNTPSTLASIILNSKQICSHLMAFLVSSLAASFKNKLILFLIVE